MSLSRLSNWFRVAVLKAFFTADDTFLIAQSVIHMGLSKSGYSTDRLANEFNYSGYGRVPTNIKVDDTDWTITGSPDNTASNSRSFSWSPVTGEPAGYVIATSFYLLQRQSVDPTYNANFYWGGNLVNMSLLLNGTIPKFNVGDLEFTFYNI